MPKPMGRPKAENPKNNVIRVRLDDNTTKRLDEYCSTENLSRADAVRRGIDMLLPDNDQSK